MRTLTLFEHQYRSYEEIGIQPDDAIIQGMEEINYAAGIEIIQLLRKGIRATQHVGVIQIGDTTIQILPKIDTGPFSDPDMPVDSEQHLQAIESATSNLLYLISYAHDFPLRATEIARMASRRSSWFEFLTRLFAADLHTQIQRGLDQNYHLIEEELPVMKGRWQIEQQIRRKPYMRHRFDVAYDEFSPDTPINRVFRYVIDSLLLTTQDAQNRSLLLDLRDWLLVARPPQVVTSDQLGRILFTRLNERFRPAFNMARLFIEGSTLQLSSGKLRTFAFVLDMNDLFEAFVEGFIQKHRNDILPDDWSDVVIRRQSKGKLVYLAHREPGSTQVFHLRPDILFTRPTGQAILILDTKYKLLDPTKENRGIAEADIYQMLAYEVRFNCKNTLLIYPSRKNVSPLRNRFSFYEDIGDVMVASINLHRSLAKPNDLVLELKEIFNSLPLA